LDAGAAAGAAGVIDAEAVRGVGGVESAAWGVTEVVGTAREGGGRSR
jgi:hypothetical protein